MARLYSGRRFLELACLQLPAKVSETIRLRLVNVDGVELAVAESSGSACPIAGTDDSLTASSAPLELDERLYVPDRKRFTVHHDLAEGGARLLRIDYGVKEITFDEEHLFPFGERLVREPSFCGREALTWGPGYQWQELRPLLEALVDEGIIKRGGVGQDDRDPRGGGLVPSLLPPSTCPVHRMWSTTECESISRELGGQAFEIGHLEAVMPMYRIAHPALDGDGRQVGEGNVFPGGLRLDLETEWRVCQYSGSRYRDRAPMNVTGLRAMIKHWKPMMATLQRIRGALRERFGPAEVWSIGELHLLSCVVLGVPTYLLMKGGGAVPQPPIHPVLSSLFRITDGIRMTTFQLLFSIEDNRPADEPLSAAQLYDFAESRVIFIGETGVCAGPRPLIDEFLAAAVDGASPAGLQDVELPPQVTELLDELPQAIDYGLLGMMAWGTSLSVWLEMSRAYERVLPIFEAAFAAGGASEALLAHLRRDWRALEKMQITLEYDRDVHWKAYQDAYERSRRSLRRPVEAVTLAQAVEPRPASDQLRSAAATLRGLFEKRRSAGELSGLAPEGAGQLAEALALLLRHEQAVSAVTDRILGEINTLLRRPQPSRSVSARDYVTFYAFSAKRGHFPYLFDTLEQELGIAVSADAQGISISDRWETAAAAASG